MKVAFIGLGNVGGKLAASLLRNGAELTVLDADPQAEKPLLDKGAAKAATPAEATLAAEVVITCLPSPAISAEVLEGEGGILEALQPNQVWLEMSTTDEAEVVRLGARVKERGGHAMDCPVSGGCHRAASGNIAILAGGERAVFERVLPVLAMMGRDILHTGALGSASALKVLTNYLASVNLLSLCEALAVVSARDMDLNTAYEAIRISSGNSFVHETESQVILNGSRNINFTLDLVVKDTGIFQAIAERAGLKLELSPLVCAVFKDGVEKYGAREWSPNIIRRLEDQAGLDIRAPGFPAEIEDDEAEVPGKEIRPRNRTD